MLTITHIQEALDGLDDSEQRRTLAVVNAYLSGKNVHFSGEMPAEIKQAGVELVQGFIKGEILQGRTEAVAVSKSVKAGDVSSSKTFSTNEKDKAMGQHEMIALALIEPFIAKFSGLANLPVIRG